MWLLMFSLLSALFVSQNSIPQSIPDISNALYMHSGTSASVSGDSCITCHVTGIDLSLASDQLCFDCHKDTEIKSRKKYHHTDIPNDKYPALSCEGCHQLHEATGQPLLKQNELDFCYSCHPETREHKSHPVITFDKGFGPQTITGSDGKIINCASHCHDLHGADYKYLCPKEPGRELCISCHKEFQ
jgi:predicted CXXCH cytochrome family protein